MNNYLRILKPKIDSTVPNFMKGDGDYCTLLALAVVTEIPYAKVELISFKAGRKRGHGFKSSVLLHYFNTLKTGKEFKKVPANMTVNNFVFQHKKGRFYVRMKGHAFAVVDGIVYNNTSTVNGSTIIVDAWELV